MRIFWVSLNDNISLISAINGVVSIAMYAPPGALQFSTTVQQQKSGTSSSGNFRRAGSTGSLSTPLEIVSVLKGEELNYVERVAIVESIRVLDTAERLDLIDLLASKNGAISSILENNAWKHFNCNPDELSQALKNCDLNHLLDFWTFIQVQMVPNSSAILYPLECETFQVRRALFTALRNKVLLPILKNHPLNSEEKIRLRPVMAAVCFATADPSDKHRQFSQLADRILFEGIPDLPEVECDSSVEESEASSRGEQLQTKSNECIGRAFSLEEEEVVILSTKPRAKTLPKSVRWDVDNQEPIDI